MSEGNGSRYQAPAYPTINQHDQNIPTILNYSTVQGPVHGTVPSLAGSLAFHSAGSNAPMVPSFIPAGTPGGPLAAAPMVEYDPYTYVNKGGTVLPQESRLVQRELVAYPGAPSASDKKDNALTLETPGKSAEEDNDNKADKEEMYHRHVLPERCVIPSTGLVRDRDLEPDAYFAS